MRTKCPEPPSDANSHPRSPRLRFLGSSWVQKKEQEKAPSQALPAGPSPPPQPLQGTSALPSTSLLSAQLSCCVCQHLSNNCNPQPLQLWARGDLPSHKPFIPSKGDWMTLFSENPPQASVICDLMRSLLIITSVVLITKGIIKRLPKEAAARAEAGEEFSTAEAPPGSLAQRLPGSMTRQEEHFIFILIKLRG